MRWLIPALGLVAVAVITVAVVWMLLGSGAGEGAVPPKPLEPAQETTATPAEESSTTSPSPSQPAAPASSPAEPTRPAGVRAKRIAYRLEGVLEVADEDGSNAKAVTKSSQGPFALSPDGTTLAHVTGGQLVLTDVATGAGVEVGPAVGDDAAVGECPVWSPDSARVYYTRVGANGVTFEVWQAGRSGRDTSFVVAGGCPTVSPDGGTVAVIGSAVIGRGGPVDLLVSRSGGAYRRVPVRDGQPIAVAAGNDRLYVAVLSSDGASKIIAMRPDGTQSSMLVGPPVDAPRASWAALRVSPDDTRIAAAAVGDDRFSRLSVVDAASGSLGVVGTRRDAYARFWGTDGAYLFYIEGNSYQGERTVLMRVERDGTGRRAVVRDAE